MTNLEAIELLTFIKNCINSGDAVFDSKQKEAINYAIAALSGPTDVETNGTTDDCRQEILSV